jgi:hypothetical protein
MKRTESEEKISKSKGASTRRLGARLPRLTSPQLRFVVCINDGGFVDLEPLKVYRVRRDKDALAHNLLRVVDGSGEDYLYPARFFRPIYASSKLFTLIERSA